MRAPGMAGLGRRSGHSTMVQNLGAQRCLTSGPNLLSGAERSCPRAEKGRMGMPLGGTGILVGGYLCEGR